MSTFVLALNERVRFVGIVGNLSDFTGGPRERSVFLGLAGLHKFREGLDLDGIPRVVAANLVEKLELHGLLEEQPKHYALGALCEYMIEHIPEQPQRDKQFLAELIVKYGLIKDAAYIQQLRTRFNITMQSQSAQSEASVLPTQPATSLARKSGGIPTTLLADVRQALLACDEIYDPAQLRAVLRTSPLQPFVNNLKTANNANMQVDYLIGDFAERQLVTGENGLALLLKVLGNRYDPADAQHDQLLNLAEALQKTNNTGLLENTVTSKSLLASGQSSQGANTGNLFWERAIREQDWTRMTDGGYSFRIKAEEYNRGHAPMVEVFYQASDGTLSREGVNDLYHPNGDIELQVNVARNYIIRVR